MTKEEAYKILDAHGRIQRNGRCICGWRPTWPDERFGAEFLQYRDHMASMLSGEQEVNGL